MANVVETSVQAEGSDELRVFLIANKDKLKLSNTSELAQIYNQLVKGDVGYDDLLGFDRDVLKETLKECNIASKYIGRIISVLKQIPKSEIYQEAHSPKKEIVRILVSVEE